MSLRMVMKSITKCIICEFAKILVESILIAFLTESPQVGIYVGSFIPALA